MTAKIDPRQAERARYEAFHQRRFAYLAKLATTLCPDLDTRVLDVGPSGLTKMLSGHYRSVSALGLEQQGL